jgi:processive 1,2-diacylglycerol beta-glucosyltransferase
MKTVILIYASIGSGHKMAAEAIRENLISRNSGYSVQMVDILDFSKSDFIRSTPKEINTGSRIVGSLYNSLWGKETIGEITQRAVGLIKENFSSLKKYLKKENPFFVICTHALGSLLVSEYKKGKDLICPHFAVLTDFRSNQTWPTSSIDRYFVPSLLAKIDLVKKGVDSKKISITGIPLRNQFIKEKSKIKNNSKGSDRFNILLVLGGENNTAYKNISRKAHQITKKIIPFASKLTIVCGANLNLKKSLTKIYVNFKMLEKIKVTGFEKNLAGIMAKHDIVIAKSGGITSSEVVFLEKPFIIFGENYGPEKANTDFLVNKKVAIQVKKTKEIPSAIKTLQNPETYNHFVKNARKLSFPSPSEKIIDLIEKISKNYSAV